MRYLRAPWMLDVALAVGIGALQLFGTYMAAQSQPDARALDGWAVLLLGGGALCLIVRRRYPVAVFAVAFVTTFAYELLDYPGGPIWGTLIVAFFTLMLQRAALARLRSRSWWGSRAPGGCPDRRRRWPRRWGSRRGCSCSSR